jgi:hypothetical protein
VVAVLDLQNGPDACRLVSPTGAEDRLGWGEDLDSSYFEGEASPDVASGRSLSRLPDGRDTDHNASDFAEADPTPGAFNAPERLLLVRDVAWPPAGAGGGQVWTFRGVARNAGRTEWSGSVRIGCVVHPAEELAALRVEALSPGESEAWEARAAPPPGVHLPRIAPAGVDAGVDVRSDVAWWGPGADLAVTEILAAPVDGGPEWVELTSLAPTDVSLEPFHLRDASGTRGGLAGTLRPGARVVVTSDAAEMAARWDAGDVREVSPWPTLNQTAPEGEVAERIALVLGEEEVTVGVVPGRGASGVAWERIALSLPGEEVGAWAPSLDPSGGTPGRDNTRRGDRRLAPGTTRAQVDPQPYRPQRDGAALVVLRSLPDARVPEVDVWDSSGRRVAVLSAWRAGSGEFRAAWDGRREDGSAAPLGLYLVRASVDRRSVARTPLVLVR